MVSWLDKARHFFAPLRGAARQPPQRKADLAIASEAASPDKFFGKFDDESWLWANTVGYREQPVFHEMLPAMPPEGMQELFTGASGDETLIRAFRVYTLFKQIIDRHYGGLSRCENILDFGCGWGRITRFFLRDLDPTGIWGVDCIPSIVEFCKQTNRWCNFQAVSTTPPTTFPDNMFDVIYSYSVFSHLSEDIHQRWISEFERILKPGGLLIATTRGREFIEFCSSLREQGDLSSSSHLAGLSSSFQNTQQVLLDYDEGKYCHHPTGGGFELDKSFYGETCIPRDYVLKHWTRHFTFVDYLAERAIEEQNVIVVRKRA